MINIRIYYERETNVRLNANLQVKKSKQRPSWMDSMKFCPLNGYTTLTSVNLSFYFVECKRLTLKIGRGTLFTDTIPATLVKSSGSGNSSKMSVPLSNGPVYFNLSQVLYSVFAFGSFMLQLLLYIKICV